MSYNKNDRGGWSQVASSDKSSDNRGLKELKRDYYVHRAILIAVEVAAFVLLVVFFHLASNPVLLFELIVLMVVFSESLHVLVSHIFSHKYKKRMVIEVAAIVLLVVFLIRLDSRFASFFEKVIVIGAFMEFSRLLYVLDSHKYKKLIVEYLLKEFKGELQHKEEGPTGLSLALLRETRLWGSLYSYVFLLWRYTHDINDEDHFSSKKYPFCFFEFELTLATGPVGNRSKETLFHGPVVKVKLPSKVDGLIVKNKENQSQKLDALWDEVTSESQNLIQKSPFAMFANDDNLFIFFENKHDLFDPSFWKGASDKRIAEDTNYIRAMYQIGKLVCERMKVIF